MDDPRRYKVLIVDDALDNIKILIDLLRNDYDTFFSKSGKKALQLVKTVRPDIILLDVVMPEMDGYEVCSRLKKDKLSADIPVIFISARNQVGDETMGLDLGAVDYIAKPISPPILKARIRNHLKLSNAMTELKRLYSMALDASPLTGLPGNNSIARRIKLALANHEKICVIYTDLDNFKAYNDKYGFAKGDDVILFNSTVLQESLIECGVIEYFIGHIGGDDFVVTLPMDQVDRVTQTIIERFDREIPTFYTEMDRQRQSIVALNRQGEKQIFPLITISMAGVDIMASAFEMSIQVNDACSEGKKRAKKIQGSAFVMERRNGMPTSYQ